MKITTTAIEEVIEVLISKYPNGLPKNHVDSFELGRLIGQQDVIRYLVGQLEIMETKNGTKTTSR